MRVLDGKIKKTSLFFEFDYLSFDFSTDIYGIEA